jgi:hypothetical protein
VVSDMFCTCISYTSRVPYRLFVNTTEMLIYGDRLHTEASRFTFANKGHCFLGYDAAVVS